jgi:cytochrome c2
LALLVAAAIFGRRQRTRWALLLAVAGLAAAGAGLASAAADREAPQARAADAPVVAQTGETLFVAKGCVQCHRNDRVERDLVVFSTEMGPDLTNYQASAEYLRVWLKDPQTAKPQTQMPNLGLSEVEMEALIAFLSHKP